MKTGLLALLLLSLALTGCVIEPGRGYGYHGDEHRGEEHHEMHGDRGR